jgi:hypothetical protein
VICLSCDCMCCLGVAFHFLILSTALVPVFSASLALYTNILSTNVSTRPSDKFSSSGVTTVSMVVKSVFILDLGLVVSTSGWHKAL